MYFKFVWSVIDSPNINHLVEAEHAKYYTFRADNADVFKNYEASELVWLNHPGPRNFPTPVIVVEANGVHYVAFPHEQLPGRGTCELYVLNSSGKTIDRLRVDVTRKAVA